MYTITPNFPELQRPPIHFQKKTSNRPPRPPDPTENIVYIDILSQGVKQLKKKSDWLYVIPIVISANVIGRNNDTHLLT